jgi:hypothetical protein
MKFTSSTSTDTHRVAGNIRGDKDSSLWLFTFCFFSSLNQKKRRIIWPIEELFVPLHRRLSAHLWAAGGLIYEKDVFERLSL